MQQIARSRIFRAKRTLLHAGILINVLATYSHNFFEFGGDMAKSIYFIGNSAALSLIGYYLHLEVKDPIVSFWFFWQLFLFANRSFLGAEIEWKSLTGLGIILLICVYRNFRNGKRENRNAGRAGEGLGD